MSAQDGLKHTVDVAAVTTVGAAIVGWLPAIAAAAALAWHVWRFWHDPDARRKAAAAWACIKARFGSRGPA